MSAMSTAETVARVKAMRESCTIEQVAKLVGVSWRTIMRWERGETTPDSPPVVAALKKASRGFYEAGP
jgi:DNA-binding transcriptional regulator YiaG